MGVVVRAIEQPDLAAVGRFMQAELNPAVTAETWASAPVTPWPVQEQNFGYLLESDGEIVGAYLAFYSERIVDGQPVRFCNLGAWCVREDSRFHSVRLLKAMLAQPGYTFTDLSPSGPVIKLNERMGFTHLDTATALMPCLPYPTRPGRVRISSDPRRLAAELDGPDATIFRDHQDARAAHHLLVEVAGRRCYVIFRQDRRKDLPIFASILYVSDPVVFAAAARAVARHLLLRHRVLAMLVEPRVAGRRPTPSMMLRTPRRKMFRSPTLAADQIDYLYSELVCLAW